MIICICTEYKTSDLIKDLNEKKSLKNIINDLEIEFKCKKCCKFLKEEYQANIDILNM